MGVYWAAPLNTASELAQSSLLPGSTYRLETFGKLTLTGGATGAVSHQRRRLALLALLAASGDRGVSRDKIVAYFWPESPSELGRHSLEQLLHALRRALGDSVFKGANPVGLDSTVVASDVAEFESALSRGALEDAVALYSGPFLHGFYLEDAPEFERWMTTETARLANRYAEALTRLAAGADKSGDHAAEVRWLRRLVDADPVSSRNALSLMRALVASGDRTAALQHARLYEALVKQELETEPDPSVTSYAASLRAGGGADTARIAPSTPAARGDLPVAQRGPLATESPAPTPSQPSVAVVPPPLPTVHEAPRNRRLRWIAAAASAAIILVVAGLFTRNNGQTPTQNANRIVVVPFRITAADSSLKYLSEGVADLMAPMLTGEGGPVAVDSRTAISTWNRITRGHDGTADDARRVAHELGATYVLTGSVVEAGGKLTINGSVISADTDDARALNSVEGSVDSVTTLLDRFVGQLLVRQAGVAETSVAAITSQSLPAIRAYLSGRAAYRRADNDRAIQSFMRALDIDSTFALAALDLVVATGQLLRTQICRNNACRVISIVPGFASNESDDAVFRRAVEIAWDNRLKLGRRDRPLLQAIRGRNYPSPSSARETLDNLQRAVLAAPDRPETQYLLGTLILYQGAGLGISDWPRQAESAFRTASKLDSSYAAPLARLVDAAVFAGDTAKVRRAAILYLAHDTVTGTASYVRWLFAVATADTMAQRVIRSGFRSLDRPTLDHIYLTSQMTGMAVDDADSASVIMADNAADPLEKSVAFRRASILALNRGRPASATKLLHQMDELRSDRFTFLRISIQNALFGDGDHAVADSSARELERVLARDTLPPLTSDDERRIFPAMSSEALWYLSRGDSVHAASATQWARRHAESQPRSRIGFLFPEMLIASRARRANGAALRAFVDSISRDGCCEFPETGNLMLARAYEESGDAVAALRVIRRGVWFYPPRSLSTYLRQEGRLAAQVGDRAEATRAYAHYLAMRSNPEPSLRAQRDSVSAELDRLKQMR